MIFNVGQGGGSGKLVHLNISYDASLAGATITATNGSEVHTAEANESGLTVISGTKLGEWTITESMFSTSAVVNTTFYGNYNAGLGGNIKITVSFESAFTGKTLTLTNGSKTYTRVATGSSVLFVVADTGTWTVSGTVDGQTYSSSINITEDGSYNMSLALKPDGSTVTPVNDIQTWLACGGINKSYTGISQVLADSTTLSALMADNNAVDYLVRSTDWVEAVCSNESAMTYIGLNNYCANKLLTDSTWCTAIYNSTYFEKVLNVKVPTMTSNTEPYGEASASKGNETAYKAFDNNLSTLYFSNAYVATNKGTYIQYAFNKKVIVKSLNLLGWNVSTQFTNCDFILKGSNDGTDFETLGTITNDSLSLKRYIVDNDKPFKIYRLECDGVGNYKEGTRGYAVLVGILQFYGREEA